MFSDLHCDTISAILAKEKEGTITCLSENGFHVDADRLQKQAYELQCFALFVDKRQWKDPKEGFDRLYECYEKQMDICKDVLLPVRTVTQLKQCRQEGKVAAILTVEEGAVCQGRVELLRELFEKGVRMMAMVWNFPNELAYPAINYAKGQDNNHKVPERTKGLTPKGREFVARMEDMGMLVDVSHMSDKAFYDVAEICRRPFVASHSCAREVCPVVRNLSDDMIRTVAQNGGVIGVNFYDRFLFPDFIKERSKEAWLEAIAAHLRHLVLVGGEEVAALGSDFDGIPADNKIAGAQDMPLLRDMLHKKGFSETQMDKICDGNARRVIADSLPD